MGKKQYMLHKKKTETLNVHCGCSNPNDVTTLIYCSK